MKYHGRNLLSGYAPGTFLKPIKEEVVMKINDISLLTFAFLQEQKLMIFSMQIWSNSDFVAGCGRIPLI